MTIDVIISRLDELFAMGEDKHPDTILVPIGFKDFLVSGGWRNPTLAIVEEIHEDALPDRLADLLKAKQIVTIITDDIIGTMTPGKDGTEVKWFGVGLT